MADKSTYTPDEAAAFLGISVDKLAQLTAEGEIRSHCYRKRVFYLGGDLDVARCALQTERKLLS
jgi:excisionase family DNA binding protein